MTTLLKFDQLYKLRMIIVHPLDLETNVLAQKDLKGVHLLKIDVEKLPDLASIAYVHRNRSVKSYLKTKIKDRHFQ